MRRADQPLPAHKVPARTALIMTVLLSLGFWGVLWLAVSVLLTPT